MSILKGIGAAFAGILALLGISYFSPVQFGAAQIVPAQNQLIIAPFGGPGWVVSTTTSGTNKLEASSTPHFNTFSGDTGTITNLTITGTCTGCSSGSGITNLGPTGQLQSGTTQTLATTTNGTDFTITAAGDTQSFNLPVASALNTGKLSSTDWTTFNNKNGWSWPFPNNATSTKLSFNGGLASAGIFVNGISTDSLTHGAAIDYIDPNLRFSLPSTEGYSWYNQGRGVNLLMSLDGSTGGLRLAKYGSGSLTGTPTYSISVDSSGNLIETPSASTFAYPFPNSVNAANNNATSSVVGFTGGLDAYATSTIGNGTQAGGLTIFGGATTTGNFLVNGSSTIQNFTFVNATGSSATTTNLFTTTASSTNLFGQLINGFSLSTCNSASSALTWSGGSFGCHSITTSGASTTLLGDNNTFSGNDTFNNIITGSISGNAGTATILQTTHTINSVGFDGSTDITITAASSTLLANNNAFSGANSFAGLLVTSSSTLQNFTALQSTSTNATTTNFFATTASSTNLFGTNINGFGLSSCAGASNALTWTGGTFGCNSITSGSASSTLLGDNNTFTGNNMFLASTTVGNGTAKTGLTIAGTATTTGNAYISGNMGIGTTSLANPLTVGFNGANAVLIDGNSSNSVGYRIHNTIASGGDWIFYSSGGAPAPVGSFGVYDQNAGTSRLVIAPTTGNIGIGTTTPNWMLQVTGTRPSLALSDSAGGVNLKHWLLSSMGGEFYIGTSSDAYATSTFPALSILNGGQVSAYAVQPATTTTITMDWSTTPNQVEYRIGTSATTITMINATTSKMWGARKLVWVCNPGASAGALTWVGVEWIGTAPTQTTTANQCDAYSFDVTHATSTSAYKVAGTAGTGFQ